MSENIPPPTNYSQPTTGYSPRGFYPPGIHWEFIGEAFNLIKAYPGVWIGASVAVLILTGVVGQIPGLIINFLFYGSVMPPTGPEAPEMSKSLMVTAATIPFSLLVHGFSNCLYAGMASMAAEQVQTGYARLKIFDYIGNIVKCTITSVLSGLAILLAFLLFIIPGIYVAGRLYMAPYYSAIEGLGPMEAMKKSWDTFEPHAWSMFAFILVSSIVCALGIIACCVGFFYTFPVLPICIGMTLLAFHPTIFGGMSPTGASPTPYPREDTSPPPGWPPVGPQ